MNKIRLSIAVLLLSSVQVVAGGDFGKVVEPAIDIPVVEVPAEKTGFYAGLAYSCMQITNEVPDEEYMGNGFSLLAGYNINPYLAVEARYTASIGDVNYQTWGVDEDIDTDLSNIGLYLKPQYAINMFKVYGLLGYGQVTLDNGNSYSEASIQYGAGVSASVTEDIDVFIDYRRLYDDTGFDDYTNADVAANSWSLGVNYNF